MKPKIEKISVLTKTVEENMVRVEILAVEVEKMRSELFEAEWASAGESVREGEGFHHVF